PPVPGAPWTQIPGGGIGRGGVGSARPSAPAGTSTTGKPFIARVPEVENRLRRFTENVSDIFNSLIAHGFIVQTGPSSYEIVNLEEVLTSPLTTKGDLWGFSSTNARIPLGTT